MGSKCFLPKIIKLCSTGIYNPPHSLGKVGATEAQASSGGFHPIRNSTMIGDQPISPDPLLGNLTPGHSDDNDAEGYRMECLETSIVKIMSKQKCQQREKRASCLKRSHKKEGEKI